MAVDFKATYKLEVDNMWDDFTLEGMGCVPAVELVIPNPQDDEITRALVADITKVLFEVDMGANIQLDVYGDHITINEWYSSSDYSTRIDELVRVKREKEECLSKVLERHGVKKCTMNFTLNIMY
ncbi:MAG: hypothetical protein KHY44_14980 [Clostridiales bacterium]|jgi:hypothetical protein|nr:hypothetical protein [Clostridiales bacterium]